LSDLNVAGFFQHLRQMSYQLIAPTTLPLVLATPVFCELHNLFMCLAFRTDFLQRLWQAFIRIYEVLCYKLL